LTTVWSNVTGGKNGIMIHVWEWTVTIR
jgi:hypothetical protein